MNLKCMKLFPLIFILFVGNANAQKELSIQEVMSISKMAGACGILDLMIHFQKTTKISGGNEFVTRFWATEAARLGLSMQAYSDQCNQSIEAYDKLWNVMEATK